MSRIRTSRTTLALVSFALIVAGAFSDLPAMAETPAEKSTKEGRPDPVPSVTQHTATCRGVEIAFTATAGKLAMQNDAMEHQADIFYVAYTKNGADLSKRPVTFCFNGGPGSSSVWLHLGMLGPKRVRMDDDAKALPPPHELIENPHCLLDKTDLVFIDPVSTGYSRPAEGKDKKQFHGYDEDVRSIGQFIHDYTTRNGRWASPKFLLGESYGGLRAAGLCGELQRRYHMYLNGVVLISAVVDFQTLRAAGNNDIAYCLSLPGYAATAWYHKALPESTQSLPLQDIVAQAEAFARDEYLQALLAGDSLEASRREPIVDRMAELTGLSASYIDNANLRINMSRFGKELLRSRQQVVGRFDSRYTGNEGDHNHATTRHDPSGSVFFGPFTSAMNQYLRDDLKVQESRVYEILTGKVHPWDYSEFENRYVDASPTLRDAIRDNPHLQVFAACGYFDLATPQFAMQHTRNHLHLPAELQKHFQIHFYEAGHMMYVHEPSLKKLSDDLARFYDGVSTAR